MEMAGWCWVWLGTGTSAPGDLTPEFVAAEDAKTFAWDLATVLIRTVEAGNVSGNFLVMFGPSRSGEGIRQPNTWGTSYGCVSDEDRVRGLRAISGAVVATQDRRELVRSVWELLEDFLSQRRTVPNSTADQFLTALTLHEI